MSEAPIYPEIILYNATITTLDPDQASARAVAIQDGRFLKVGSDSEVLGLKGPDTKLVDCHRKRIVPGINDSHLHVIRGGLHYMNELRWDGVQSVSQALFMLKQQAERTPAPQWVRVVGGWTEQQFAEKRRPTLAEINRAAPETPVFILHLYAHAMLNKAALKVLGIHANSPNPPGGLIQRDHRGNPTGLLIAEPSALILYSTLSRTPNLSPEDQVISTRHFMRELNRLGVTSAADAGGGGQNYPDDYNVIQHLADNDQLTVRIAYSLFAQNKGEEINDYRRWTDMVTPDEGNEFFRLNGAGENLVWSAADFENFLMPRPILSPEMEGELEQVIRIFAAKRWPFRIHATYNESIQRFLNIFEKVDREIPFAGLRWFIDHAETVTEESLERIKRLGGGVAIQHRMAYQGEYFVARYGPDAARRTPPVRQMLKMGLPVGGGTDATRVASYDPWVGLYWLTTGKTVGGLSLYSQDNLLSREEALRLYTTGSAWFSGENGQKGQIRAGQLGDCIVLSDDYFEVEAEAIKRIESVLTVVGGRVVFAQGDFEKLDTIQLPVSPGWSPVGEFGGYQKPLLDSLQSGHNHSHGDGLSCGCYV